MSVYGWVYVLAWAFCIGHIVGWWRCRRCSANQDAPTETTTSDRRAES